MQKCSRIRDVIGGDSLECERCGNHVCRACAETRHGICPNCFGRLTEQN